MDKSRLLGKLAELLDVQPFRIVEFLVSVPMVAYGIYLLTGLHDARMAPLNVYVLTGTPELNAEIAGALYLTAGISLFVAARSGVNLARRVSTMVFFFAMLYGMMFRWTEEVISPGSFLLFWIGMSFAGVDYMHTTRRGMKK